MANIPKGKKRVHLLARHAMDLADRGVLADSFLKVVRCGGGRLVSARHPCPHCGSKDKDNDCKGKEEQ